MTVLPMTRSLSALACTAALLTLTACASPRDTAAANGNTTA